MKTAISLELIGDDFNEAIASILPSCVSRRPWVARMLGLDADFGFKRRFMQGRKDYSRANSVGSRGVYMVYVLDPGLYEVYDFVSWKRDRRRYLWVDNQGRKEWITKEDVTEWLR